MKLATFFYLNPLCGAKIIDKIVFQVIELRLMKLTFRTLNPPIHDATCRVQLVACNKIASCVLEKLRVTSSMKLMQANRIIVYSSQHVAWSFKGLTRSAATEYLRRHGDMYMYEYL